MADVTERMFALLSILQSGGGFSGEELTRRLEISGRTLRRDIERLRGYGYPVQTRPGPGGFYRLQAGRSMPPLVLGDDEVLATMFALAALAGSGPAPPSPRPPNGIDEAAGTVYAKLEGLLPNRLRPRAAAVRNALEPPRSEAPGVDIGTLGVLTTAVDRREVITFEYRSGRDVTSERRVEPYRQVYHLLRWYLLAWDLGRGDWRVFRMDRITGVELCARRFESRELPAESALEHIRSAVGRTKKPVHLLVEADAAVVADEFRYQDVTITALPDHRCEVRAGYESWQWLLLNLAHLDADFRVIEPAEFSDQLRRFAERLCRASTVDPP